MTTPLPTWAATAEGRRLLALAIAARPARTKTLTAWVDGTAIDLGYRGRPAAALRALWDKAFMDMADLLPHGNEPARDGLIAYGKANSADAVLARLLGDAA